MIEPTGAYPHGGLGDAIEAGGVRAMLKGGMIVQLRLPEGQVFEDLMPRIADADGDGRDELVVVLTSLEDGAALAVLEVNTAGIAVAARTPFIGRANRWLNPVGVADFDGDDRPEIAYVETPHIGGVLKVWRMQGGGLAEVAELPGFSNHARGSTALEMSGVADLTGDGIADMLVPAADRSSLKAVTLVGGALKVAWEVVLPAPVATEVLWTAWDEGRAFVFGLEDGRLAILRL